MNTLGPVSSCPVHWRTTPPSVKKKIDHNQKLLVAFLRKHNPDAAVKRCSTLDTNVYSIISFRHHIFKRFKKSNVITFFHQGNFKVVPLWIHHFFVCTYMMAEFIKQRRIANLHPNCKFIGWVRDSDFRYLSWKGKATENRPPKPEEKIDSSDSDDSSIVGNDSD